MKKWTYLVASVSAVLTMGSVLTSCVDNDEPYGIQQIRVEYANLLKSKAVLADAQAKAEVAKAEAEKIKAEAEATQAEIAKIKAEAEAEYLKAQAQAELLRAQAANAVSEAEAARILAEAAIAQAKADQIKAQTEMEMKERAARLEILLAKADVTLKELELEYQQALLAFEQDKLTMSAAQAFYIEPFYKRYFDQLDAYNEAYANYVSAQQAQLKYEINLDKNHYIKEKAFEKKIAATEKKLAQAQDMLALANEKLENLKTMEPDGIYTIINEYKDKLVNLKLEQEGAALELDGLKAENKELYDLRDELNEAAIAVAEEYVEIPNYSIDAASLAGQIPNAAVADLWNESGEFPIIDADNLEYTLNDPTNYDNAVEIYNDWINQFGKYILDENGQAWTEVKINQLTAQLEGDKAAQKAATEVWTNAVALFNMGKAPAVDKLPGYDKFENAVKAYNAQATKVAPLVAAAIAARENEDAKAEALQKVVNEVMGKEAPAIIQAWQDAKQAAWDKHEADMAEVNAKCAEAVAKANADFDKTIQPLEEKRDAAKVAEDKAYRTMMVELNYNGEDSKAYKDALAAWEKANAALAAAQKALNDAYPAAWDKVVKASDKAQYERALAVIDIEDAYRVADEAADKAYNDAIAAAAIDENGYTANERKVLDDAQKALADATAALDKAVDAYNAATKRDVIYPLLLAIQDAAFALEETVGDPYNFGELNDFFTFETDVWDAISNSQELPVTEAEAIRPYNNLDAVQNVLFWASYTLFGRFDYEVSHDLGEYTAYDLDAYAYIVALDQAAVDTIIKRYFKENGVNILPVQIPEYYNLWGATGAVFATETDLALYKAFLNNTEAVQAVIDGLTEGLAAVRKTLEDQQAKQEEAFAAYDEVNDAIDAVESELAEKVANIKEQIDLYLAFVQAIYAAIDDINGFVTSDPINYDLIIVSPEVLKSNIAWIEENVIPYYEKKVEKAQYFLELYKIQYEAYQRGEAELLAPSQIDLMMAEKDLEVAQEKLDIAKAALDRAIAVVEGKAE